MKTEKQHKTENQELKEWKKPELKVLDKKKIHSGPTPADSEVEGYFHS